MSACSKRFSAGSRGEFVSCVVLEASSTVKVECVAVRQAPGVLVMQSSTTFPKV